MKTVLISGCSSGFGLATARHFLDRDWNVIATMRTPREDVLPPSERLRILALDVTKPESISRAIEMAGQIDVMVNNAGFGVPAPIELTPVELAYQLFETNVLGSIAMIQATLPQFRKKRSGVIINVSSSTTLKPLPVVGIYRASKAALNALTESLAMELKPLGIRVCGVLPGGSPETRFGANALPHLRGIDHPDYGPIIQQFVASVRSDAGPKTFAVDVAEAIWQAATEPLTPLFIPAGADARIWMEEMRKLGE
ncbi:MAG: SDR family oxidoreductase [Brasilonema octagenarum HA4186-MV1]|jgi:NAD(P)-dependent dehydrogenase (short-subunit alcohol dehydrogenase family)|nr:SDR family oxidoreductase [Brasilonema octagenarum HA4186-MV1]